MTNRLSQILLAISYHKFFEIDLTRNIIIEQDKLQFTPCDLYSVNYEI